MSRSPDRLLDDTLVSNAATGSPLAFNALHARWHPRLLRHAYRLLGNADLASDVVQEAWMDIVKGLHGLNDFGAFQAWAFRIVTRRCAKSIKTLQKRRRLEQTWHPDEDHTPPACETDLGSDILACIKQALACLSSSHRIVTELFYLEELSVSEIAIALEIPLGTVKTRLMHARHQLRSQIQGDKHDQRY